MGILRYLVTSVRWRVVLFLLMFSQVIASGISVLEVGTLDVQAESPSQHAILSVVDFTSPHIRFLAFSRSVFWPVAIRSYAGWVLVDGHDERKLVGRGLVWDEMNAPRRKFVAQDLDKRANERTSERSPTDAVQKSRCELLYRNTPGVDRFRR